MPKITIHPAGLEVEAQKGDTIMAAAWASGLRWPTTCGGQGMCTTCVLLVLNGEENLSSMGKSEASTLAQLGGRSPTNSRVRLACQARVLGDVEVEKRGVRRW